jgi:hypothetical protein
MLMFGRYAGPIDKLPGTYQPDMPSCSDRRSRSISVGYRWGPYESNLLLSIIHQCTFWLGTMNAVLLGLLVSLRKNIQAATIRTMSASTATKSLNLGSRGRWWLFFQRIDCALLTKA